MSMANVDDQTIAFCTNKKAAMWLLELGEFIWMSYVPVEPFKNMLQHCNRIEASFVSDWPGMIVQKCALQLLYRHEQCENDLLDLGKDFVTYAQGIPLVLTVLGFHLCKLTKEEWESSRNQLKATPSENILEKLQIAYNGLKDLEKKLFFDIACFFKGEDQNRVADILESIHYSDNDLRKLIDKSLFTIGGGKLCMHHLIQQMGWKFFYGESTGLGRRSRLWLSDDVFDVLKKNSVSLLLY